MPSFYTTERWASVTPNDFRFGLKLPKVITHENRLGGGEKEMNYFFRVLKPLSKKLLALVIQLPPSLSRDEGQGKLETMISLLDRNYRYAIEFRHKSWFARNTYRLLSKNKICLAWSQLDYIQTPPEVTTDFIYLRLIGDRSIKEKDFGIIQLDRQKEMELWASRIKDLKDEIGLGMMAANNHYAGFGPGSANLFRKLMALPGSGWRDNEQPRLTDF